MNEVPRWVFRYVGNKTFDFSSKKKGFFAKNDQIWPKIGIFGQFGPGHAGLFSALLVSRLVVVARGLYLARHLFTLFHMKDNYKVNFFKTKTIQNLCKGKFYWPFLAIVITPMLRVLLIGHWAQVMKDTVREVVK